MHLCFEDGLVFAKRSLAVGFRSTFEDFFHNIKVRQPIGRKVSVQAVLPRIRILLVIFFFRKLSLVSVSMASTFSAGIARAAMH
jgi:hypothetical protein